ncbi:MAG: glutathione S-transferase N-terminal domain-containing protein [Patulibacter sp.]
MQIELFRFPGSNACTIVERLLDYHQLPWQARQLRAGLHPFSLRRAGFAKPTAPAALIDGERVQGSIPICRTIADAHPELGLLPADRPLRRRTVDAEATGEQLQTAARRLLWVLAQRDQTTVAPMVAANYAGVPAPLRRLLTRGLTVGASRFHSADPAQIDQYLVAIAEVLARCDAWVQDGTLARETPTVADFQFGPSLAALACDAALGAALRARPLWRVAELACPRYPVAISLDLPEAWRKRLLAG